MNDLSAFREAARAMRSRSGFEGSFLKFSGETGIWAIGSKEKAVVVDGRRLIADVRNLLCGWQKFGLDNKPLHAGIGAVAARHEPPARATLGDLDQMRWRNKTDPWSLTFWLALFDPETRERLIFSTSSSGGRDALAILQEAFADYNENREEERWPLVELASESYDNSFGKRIHKPLFDLLGWELPPDDFLAKALKPPSPPPLPNATALKLGTGEPAVEEGAFDPADDDSDVPPF